MLIIRFFSFFALILISLLVNATPSIKHQSSHKKSRPVIALVLSGGGAKGAAHIGVIETLEKNHVPIDIVVGTSIGSYVGGLLALGYNAKQIKSMMFSVDWERGFSDFIPRDELLFADKILRDKYNITLNLGYSGGKVKLPGGLLLGQSAMQVLNQSVGDVGNFNSFDDLPIRYRAVATDLVTSHQVILHDGSIAKAMKASSTVPGALVPTKLNGQLLVDGGISNNLPVSVARSMGADIIIAVDIGSSLLLKKHINSSIDVLNQLSTIMTVTTTRQGKKLLHRKHDLLIRPDVNGLGTANFSILEEAYQEGKKGAVKQKVGIQALSISNKDYAIYQAKKEFKIKQWMAKRRRPTVKIVYNNESHAAVEFISAHFGLQPGKFISKKELATAVQRVYALNRFEFVNAEFTDTRSGRILTLTTRDKSWGPDYVHIGIGLEGDLKGTIEPTFDLGYILKDITANGGIWKNELTLGWEKGLLTQFYQPLDKKQLFFGRSTLEYKEDNYLENKSSFADERLAFYDKYTQARLGVGTNYMNNGSSEIGVLGSFGQFFYASPNVDFNGLSGKQKYRTYGGYVFLDFDDLNSVNLPTSGNKISMKLFLRNDIFKDKTLNDDVNASLQVTFDWRGAATIGSHTYVFISSFATILTRGLKTKYLSELGGFLNLSGYQKDAILGAHKAFLAVVYQYDLTRLSEGIGVPVYVGSSLEGGNVWKLHQTINLQDFIGSGSLFLGTDTSYGPALIGIGYASTIKDFKDDSLSVFFSLGKKW
ncbi:MAG: patatin-like phospholipase family protein [Psychromonas sp.]|nr:patatin-like phospholipase family protein [Psychromonas sp.]